MRALLLGAVFTASLLSGTAAEARDRTVVTITPRYLSAGTSVSPYEYRASVPDSDARFQSVTNTFAGRFSDWQPDPFYVPKPQSYRVDFGPLASKSRTSF
ncbi:MAG: hypothetical protein V4691_07680 [Pseudomonadota bacterium]